MEFGKLYKHCKEEHNLANGCDTIVLGTLKYYRELDPSYSITDPGEGSLSTERNKDEVFLEGDHLGGSIKDCTIVGGIEVECPNCYIFSLTTNDKNGDWGEYNSRYEITNLNEFMRLIAQELMNNLTIGDFENDKIPLNIIAQTMIQPQVNAIQYLDAPEITNENHREVLENISDPLKATFTKEKKFASENEIRIAFVVKDAFGNILPVKKGPKFINLRRVNNYLSI